VIDPSSIAGAEGKAMNPELPHTVIAYDAGTGKELFTEVNRQSQLQDVADTRPRAKGSTIIHNEKSFEVVSEREDSTGSVVKVNERKVAT
jgi:hypothetical protein